MKMSKTVPVLLVAAGLVALAGCADSMSEGATAGDMANEEITNNQVDGVDEGDIVKNVGDHLLVLRHGRLFAVDVSESGAMEQTDAVEVPREDDLVEGVWYDEMLVEGNDVYVIGYRYGVRIDGEIRGTYYAGATEINHFRLDDAGKLSRAETLFFESSDYYSSSDYSSRMIDGKLIFYMPFYHQRGGVFGLFRRKRSAAKLPQMLEHVRGDRFRRRGQMLEREDIVKLGKTRGDTLHTLVTCDLSGGELKECDAKAVRGGWWGTRYTTADDVFLWGEEQVYALSLTDGSITTHAAQGYPQDQFSFDFDGENLNVVVTRWDDSSRLELLRLPRAHFGEKPDQPLAQHTRVISKTDSAWIQANRFVDGEWLLVATDDWETNQTDLIAHHVPSGDTHRLPSDGSVTRLEPLSGVGALVVTQGRWGTSSENTMTLNTVTFDDGVQVVDTLEMDGSREGEWRSHGFFFKPSRDAGGGTFGLPVLASNAGWWGSGASNIAFFDVSPTAELSLAGAVSTQAQQRMNECLTSCTDWYGNTRPIFLFERIYALMGSEIAQVSLGDGTASVVQRLEMRP